MIAQGSDDFDAIRAFVSTRSIRTIGHPRHRKNPDIFFKAREYCNKFYDALPKWSRSIE
jgi:hypothetical protein